MKHKDISRLIKTLTDLDKKVQDLDEIIKDVRVAINEFFWDNAQLRKKLKYSQNRIIHK